MTRESQASLLKTPLPFSYFPLSKQASYSFPSTPNPRKTQFLSFWICTAEGMLICKQPGRQPHSATLGISFRAGSKGHSYSRINQPYQTPILRAGGLCGRVRGGVRSRPGTALDWDLSGSAANCILSAQNNELLAAVIPRLYGLPPLKHTRRCPDFCPLKGAPGIPTQSCI